MDVMMILSAEMMMKIKLEVSVFFIIYCTCVMPVLSISVHSIANGIMFYVIHSLLGRLTINVEYL